MGAEREGAPMEPALSWLRGRYHLRSRLEAIPKPISPHGSVQAALNAAFAKLALTPNGTLKGISYQMIRGRDLCINRLSTDLKKRE